MKYRLQQMGRILIKYLKELITVQLINVFVSMVVLEPAVTHLLREANGVLRGPLLINVPGFKLSLLSVLIFLLILLLLGIYYVVQFSVYFEIFNKIIKGQNVKLLKIYRDTFKHQILKINKHKIKLWILIALVVPLSFLNIINMAILPIRVPGFVLDFLRNYSFFRFFYLIWNITINILSVVFIFALFEIHMNHETFKDAFKNFFKKIFKEQERTIDILKSVIIIYVVLAAVYVLGSLGLAVVSKLLVENLQEARMFFNVEYRTWQSIMTFIVGLIFFSSLVLICHYLNDDLSDESEIVIVHRPFYMNFFYSCLIIFLLVLFSDTTQLYFGDHSQMEVFAHRGGDFGNPENTLATFKQAIDAEVSGIELDVQKLASGEYIIIHDTTFNRLANVNQKVSETLYSDVQTFHAGAYMDERYEAYPARFARFDQMLDLLKGQGNIMMELKTYTNYETNIKELLEMIEEREMVHQIQFASMDLTALQYIKTINPSVQTTYIATTLQERDSNLEYVDNYNLQVDFLTYESVSHLHYNKKKVYTWTPNKRSDIRRALALGVDGIITDEPLLAQDTIKHPDINLGVRFWDWLIFDVE